MLRLTIAVFRGYLNSLKVNSDLSYRVSLTSESLSDLSWWVQKLESPVGKGILSADPDLTIFSDASRNSSTGGFWPPSERERHFNELELLAAFLPLKYFANASRNCAVDLNLDNIAAVAYINKKECTKFQSLFDIAVELSHWCELHQISVLANHVSGVLNRHGIQKILQRLGGLEVKPTIIQKDLGAMSPENRSICVAMDHLTSALAPSTGSLGNGCVLN
jgi:hypothetical protein